MSDFNINIAGQVARVHSLFDSTRDYCRCYLTEKSPDFSVTVTREDMAMEQALSIEEARQEGFRIRYFPEPYLERAVIQRKIAEHLLCCSIVLFHGSAVAVDRQGYLFTAKSGTGKSTHTRLWREYFPDRAVMINDDKPFLKITEEAIWVCGAPWSGKHGLDTNITVPLKGICILERGADNRIDRITPEEAMPMLLHQSFLPTDGSKLPQRDRLVSELAGRLPLWRMTCTKDVQAAAVAYQAMSQCGK